MSESNEKENVTPITEAKPKETESDAQVKEEKLTPEEELTIKLKEAEDKYTYLYADFENFKKRAWNEKDLARKFGWESTAKELIGVIDNFERALSYEPENMDQNFLQGVQMITKQLVDTLSHGGVVGFDSVGKSFDPNFHEAVEKKESDEKQGTIIEERLKGYTMHGRLLRAAQVVVSEGN